jgi:hypothetical protein
MQINRHRIPDARTPQYPDDERSWPCRCRRPAPARSARPARPADQNTERLVELFRGQPRSAPATP